MKYFKASCIILTIVLMTGLLCPHIDWMFGMFRISYKAGIEPNLPALHTYLETNFTKQMSREEVHKRLHSIANIDIISLDDFYQDKRGSCEAVRVYTGYLPLNSEDLSICYDDNLKFRSLQIHKES